MPSEADRTALQDILHHIELAHSFTTAVSFDVFRDDTMRLYAVTRCLEIISEASRRLTDELKVRNSDIPWKNMAGAGNIYRHDYEDVVARRVWDTVQVALPPLRAVVERELSGEGAFKAD